VLIEDAAQAIGAIVGDKRIGTFGTGCFSFYATKISRPAKAAWNDGRRRDRRPRVPLAGRAHTYVTEELGYNYRMTEVAAALGSAQIRIDAQRTKARTPRAWRLLAPLEDTGNLAFRALPGRAHVWHSTPSASAPAATRATRCGRRCGARHRAAVFYPAPIHRQPLYRRLGYSDRSPHRAASP
jgi:dTDP-4-amino-4,6-dideoxygalactose transaminase